MSSTACSICNAENLEELEELGLLAQAGDISWREAMRRGELNHFKKLQVHMDNHYVAPVQREANAFTRELDEEVLRTQQLLLEKARMSPVDVRPMYLTAIHNLAHLHELKPSQQVMVQALKAATEMTGMKMEQQLMVEFAQYAFEEQARNAELPEAKPDELLEAMKDADIVTAELVSANE